MSDQALRRIWALSLIVGGVCAVAVGALSILGKALPWLNVLLLAALTVMLVSAAKLYGRGKK